MASYDNLPVYKTTYELLSYVFRMNRHVSRDYRYTLCETLKKELIDMLILIYKANMVTDKVGHIAQAREKIAVVKIYLRLLCDLKQISIKQFAQTAEMSESVSKQLASWYKIQENKRHL